MKIVHASSEHRADDVRIHRKECRSLVSAGYELSYAVFHSGPEPSQGPVRILSAGPRPPTTKTGFLSWMRRMVRIDRVVRRAGGGLIHFHDPDLIPLALLWRLRGKKVIYDIHEDFPRQWISRHAGWVRYPVLGRPLPAFIWRAVEAVLDFGEILASRFMTALIPATPAIASRFMGVTKPQALIQNFPILDEFSGVQNTPQAERPASFAYIGTTNAVRGLLTMVDALGRLSPGSVIRLALAGQALSAGLRKEAESRAGWSRVVERGYLDREGIRDLLGSVRAGLVLLHPEPRFQVSLPVKMFEYMAAGIPVIASDFPFWRAILEPARCGLLVDPMDPQAIAKAMTWILEHPEEAQAMGQRGRSEAEKKHNWAAEEPKLLKLYDQILGGSS